MLVDERASHELPGGLLAAAPAQALTAPPESVRLVRSWIRSRQPTIELTQAADMLVKLHTMYTDGELLFNAHFISEQARFGSRRGGQCAL